MYFEDINTNLLQFFHVSLLRYALAYAYALRMRRGWGGVYTAFENYVKLFFEFIQQT